MTEVPMVTVLVPAKNEEADIERCLQAVLAQDHPHDRMEIVLVDGASTDATAAVAGRVLDAGDVPWRIVENPVGTTPSNLNAGLAVATGEVLCRVDARSVVPGDYVRRCATLLLRRPELAVVGGAQIALARSEALEDRAIARALNNRVALGGARYRAGADSGPTDTVYLGAFRSASLRAVGGWREELETNQDFELNRRFGETGVVWFEASLAVGYLPRRSVRSLVRQYHRFGRWKVRYWRLSGRSPEPRQWLALGLGSAALGATAALGLVHLRSEPSRTSVALVGGALATALLIDEAGSTESGGLRLRLSAGGLNLAIAASWLLGVYRELCRSRPWCARLRSGKRVQGRPEVDRPQEPACADQPGPLDRCG